MYLHFKDFECDYKTFRFTHRYHETVYPRHIHHCPVRPMSNTSIDTFWRRRHKRRVKLSISTATGEMQNPASAMLFQSIHASLCKLMPIEVQRILAQSQRMLANRHEVEECIPASRIPQLTQTHIQRSEESLPAPDTSALCACVSWTGPL